MIFLSVLSSLWQLKEFFGIIKNADQNYINKYGTLKFMVHISVHVFTFQTDFPMIQQSQGLWSYIDWYMYTHVYTYIDVLLFNALPLHFTANNIKATEWETEVGVWGLPGQKYLPELYQGSHPEAALWLHAGTPCAR